MKSAIWKNLAVILLFAFVTSSQSQVLSWGGSDGKGNSGGCGSCSAPIEPNARRLFKLLSEDSDEELNQKKSDPNLCTTIDCFGLTTEQAHSTIENIFEQRRFETTFQQTVKDAELTRYLTLLSLLIGFVSLLISLRHRPTT